MTMKTIQAAAADTVPSVRGKDIGGVLLTILGTLAAFIPQLPILVTFMSSMGIPDNVVQGVGGFLGFCAILYAAVTKSIAEIPNNK